MIVEPILLLGLFKAGFAAGLIVGAELGKPGG